MNLIIKEPIIRIPLIIVLLFPFYHINRITINEIYMRFISYDVVNCEIDENYGKYRRSADLVFNFIYFYEGKLYNSSDRISGNDEVSKMILSGKKYIPLYVSPIFPSYNALSRPSFNTFYDWFGMAVMIILSLFTFTLLVGLLFLKAPYPKE